MNDFLKMRVMSSKGLKPGFKITWWYDTLQVKWSFRKYQVELWQRRFLWTGWKNSECVHFVLYLSVISIHRLHLLAPPAQYARLIPAIKIQHTPDQSSVVSMNQLQETHTRQTWMFLITKETVAPSFMLQPFCSFYCIVVIQYSTSYNPFGAYGSFPPTYIRKQGLSLSFHYSAL